VQQRIDRLTTPDGVEIAYSSLGSGRPILYVSGWLSHLQLSWELPQERTFYEGLAAPVPPSVDLRAATARGQPYPY
jgi:hypothetical protein